MDKEKLIKWIKAVSVNYEGYNGMQFPIIDPNSLIEQIKKGTFDKKSVDDLEIKIGDIVEFIHNPLVNSRCYPPFGTKGIVKNIYNLSYNVQWQKGTTASDGIWFTNKDFVKKVKGDKYEN